MAIYKETFTMQRRKIIFCLVLALSMTLCVLFILKPGKWDKYFQRSVGNPPNALIVESLSIATAVKESPEPIAIDLGCGTGNETAYLLKNGFKVFAIDQEKTALKILNARSDIAPYKYNLQTMNINVESLDFHQLPMTDILVASFSVPFYNPAHFDHIFADIKRVIKPGGYFVGHFFDPNYEGFTKQERKLMTFHTKEQIQNLFKDFNIIVFRDVLQSGKSKTDRNIKAHYYEVIAEKKPKKPP